MAEFEKGGDQMQQGFSQLSSQLKGVTLSPTSDTYPSLPDPESSLRAPGLLFVDEVPNDFYCPLCLDVLTDTCLTSCGHYYCSRCIAPLKATDAPCPVCREKNFSTMRNLAVERQIGAMKVYCFYHGNGCVWMGPRSYLDEHVKAECSFADAPCLFQKFGCTARLLHTEINDHFKSNFAEHMLMVSSAKKKQQQEAATAIEERDRKIEALERRLVSLEMKFNKEIQLKCDIVWHPLSLSHATKIGGFDKGVPQGCTLQMPLPMNIIPMDTKEILLHVAGCAGLSLPHADSYFLKVYVKDRGVKYNKSMRITTCKQDAYSNNTENMWFPMPADRFVYLEVPRKTKPLERNVRCNVYIIGYR